MFVKSWFNLETLFDPLRMKNQLIYLLILEIQVSIAWIMFSTC